MMIKTAGGPGLVSPIDFHERRTPRLSKAAWAATGIVVAAHVGLGVALYYQRFELRVPIEHPQPPITTITLERPVVKLEPPKPVPAPPQARNTKFNDTPAPPVNIEPIHVSQGETVAEAGETISIVKPALEPVDNGVGTEPVPPQPPAVIRNPSWSRQPSAEQMMAAYPRRAITDGVAGSATLNCLVQSNGSVADCNVTRETPGGYSFGRAAQSLSRHFRVNPRTVNGAAEGSRVSINLRFTLPED